MTSRLSFVSSDCVSDRSEIEQGDGRMKTMKWVGWCGAVLLVASLMWTTGCGSDGDDGTSVVVTNSVVTNAPVPQAMVAPQLVTPADNQSYNSYGGVPVEVDFEWTAVPGAVSYVFELNGAQQAAATTTLTQPLAASVYQWRVWGKDANGASGPPSSKFKVTIVAAIGPPPP